jgi:hypothetical protein
MRHPLILNRATTRNHTTMDAQGRHGQTLVCAEHLRQREEATWQTEQRTAAPVLES